MYGRHGAEVGVHQLAISCVADKKSAAPPLCAPGLVLDVMRLIKYQDSISRVDLHRQWHNIPAVAHKQLARPVLRFMKVLSHGLEGAGETGGKPIR
jgi:hypothetical protein